MHLQRLDSILADIVLTLHVGIVVFVVGGLFVIIWSGLRNGKLIRSIVFRIAHLVAIGIVAAQAWLGVVCPLTTLENWLRSQAHETTYSGGFIAHWLDQLLYYDAAPWVFTLAYTLFGLAVLATWIIFPPQQHKRTTVVDGTHSE